MKAQRIWHGLLDEPQGKGWDNAPTEGWFGSFKNERVYGERYEVIAMAFEYIEMSSTLGYKSPAQFLSNWLIAQQQEKLVA